MIYNGNSASTVQNKTLGYSAKLLGNSASSVRVLDTFRAAIRCECQACGNHKKRCTHIAGRRVSHTRHPVVIHRIDGRVLCHVCLNRLLERASRRLYSPGRTWIR